MVKKVFALASITALTTVIVAIAAAGCSDNGVAVPAEDGGSEPDAKEPPPIPDDDDDDDDDDDKCYDEKPVDVSGVKYQPPRVQPGACTDKVLQVIDDLVAAKPSASFDELKAAIKSEESTECAECVFAEDGDTWAPVVQKDGKTIAVNGGGCIDLVSEKAGCGDAYFRWNLCIRTTCQNCSGGEATSCSQEVQTTACKAASDALVAACGEDVNTYLGECFPPAEVTVKGPIREQCIKGVETDAGAD